MYDPDSPEDDWEWIEIYNNSAGTIDLTGYVVDNIDVSAHSIANISGGSIPMGESAVLYNADDINTTDFEDAWAPDINLIAVTNWAAMELGNDGDQLGIWASFPDYSGDHQTHANAINSVDYGAVNFPDPVGSSIYLTDLGLNNTDGNNWVSSTDDGSTPIGTGRQSKVAGTTNSGLDIGSPKPDVVVTSVDVPAAATYSQGEALEFVVNFSATVFVDFTFGTPFIPITIGSSVVEANYVPAAAAPQATFSYTVEAGDLDTDGIEVGAAIDPNGGTLQDDVGGKDIIPDLNNAGSTSGVLVDGVGPEVVSILRELPMQEFTNGDELFFRVTFNEDVAVPLDVSDFTLSGTSNGTINSVTAVTTNTVFDVEVIEVTQEGILDIDPLTSITDTEGNPFNGVITNEETFTIDQTAPVATVDNLITNDPTPELTGTIDDPDATIKVSVSGSTLFTATNKMDGTWTLPDDALAPPLGTGTHDVVLTGDDPAENGFNETFLDAIEVDLVVPMITVDNLITTDNTPELTGTIDDPSATIQVQVDGGTLFPATNNGDGTWTLPDNTITPPLPDGTFDVMAAATDAAENVGTDLSMDELTVDTTVPMVTVSSIEPDPTTNTTFDVTIDFTEPVSGFDISDIEVTNATLSNFSGATNPTFTVDVSPLLPGTVSVEVPADVAVDLIGNGNTASNVLTREFQSDRPTVAITSAESDPTNADPFSVTITFSEEVMNFVAGDIMVSNGTAPNLNISDNIVFTADISASVDGLVTVDVPENVAQDLSGNGNFAAAATFSITFDGTSPAVTISSTATDPTNLSPIPVTIDFDENVTGFEESDIMVTNGATSGFVMVSPNEYTVDVTPAADGTVTVDVPQNSAQDNAGNGNTAATTFSIESDRTAPTVTLSSTAPDPTEDAPIPITITFSEPVLNFVQGDLMVTNGTLSNFSGSGADYTADIDPSAPGTVTVDLPVNSARDVAENGNTAATFSIEFQGETPDTTDPVVTLSSSSSDIIFQPEFSVSIAFNETITGFELTDINVTNGTASNFMAISSAEYSVDITAIDFGLVTVTVPAGVAQDGAGNGNQAGSISRTYEQDATPPAITLSSNTGNPTNQDPIQFRIVFDEDIVGFESSDLMITNGNLLVITSPNPNEYFADVQPTTDGEVILSIPAGSVQDQAGNDNEAVSLSVTFDGTGPEIEISASPLSDGDYELTFSFSEPVQGFEEADIEVTNGEITAFELIDNISGSANISSTISSGDVTVSISAGTFTDIAGNDNEDPTTLIITITGTDFQELADVEIYPNPAVNYLSLEFGKATDFSSMKVEIYDIFGNRRLSLLPAYRSLRIDVRTYQSGIYLLRISDGRKLRIEKFQVVR